MIDREKGRDLLFSVFFTSSSLLSYSGRDPWGLQRWPIIIFGQKICGQSEYRNRYLSVFFYISSSFFRFSSLLSGCGSATPVGRLDGLYFFSLWDVSTFSLEYVCLIHMSVSQFAPNLSQCGENHFLSVIYKYVGKRYYRVFLFCRCPYHAHQRLHLTLLTLPPFILYGRSLSQAWFVLSIFKFPPLNNLDLNNEIRASYSYVNLLIIYPCRGLIFMASCTWPAFFTVACLSRDSYSLPLQLECFIRLTLICIR